MASRGGTNPGMGRAFNRRVVLETIRLTGPLPRAEIARRTALALQTVVNITEDLIAEGLVREQGLRRGGRGAPAREVALDPEGGFTIGLSLDHRRLVVTLVDIAGHPRRQGVVAVAGLTPEATIAEIVRAIRRTLRSTRIAPSRVLGVGLAMPMLFERGIPVTLGPSSIPEWAGWPIGALLERRLGVAVVIENDATAAAIGEQFHGVGRRLNDFFYVYVGAGIGGGLVLAGHPYRGSSGRAGEFGHVVVAPGGRRCACGSRGCLERYASLAAAQAAIDGQAEAACPVDPDRIATAFAARERRALAWVEEAGRHLATALQTVENLLDPEAIVFGGSAPAIVLDALIGATMRERRAAPVRAGCQILKAELDLETPALGAAALPLLHQLTPGTAVLRKTVGAPSTPGSSALPTGRGSGRREP